MSMMFGTCSHGTLKWVPSPIGSGKTPVEKFLKIAHKVESRRCVKMPRKEICILSEEDRCV